MAVPYHYERNIYKVGHSYVVSIPAIWVKANRLDKKKKVVVEAYPDRIVITKKE